MSTRILSFLILFAGASAGTVPASAQILNTLRGFNETEPGWSGQVQGAVALADGNTEYLEIELGAGVQWRTGDHRFRLLGRHMRRTASGVETAESRTGHLRHNLQLKPWLATVAFLQGQHDPFKRIDSRILVGAGLRTDLFRETDWKTSIGTVVMREDESLTGIAGYETDVRLSVFVSVLRTGGEGVSLDLSGFWQPKVDDFSDARALASAVFRADLVGDLYLHATYGLEHDSHPAAGVERPDQTIRSGLGYRL